MTKRLSWAVRLERAELKGSFTNNDRENAGQWNKCAIGEKHGFPRHPSTVLAKMSGEEIYDSLEYRLGMEFMTAVGNNDVIEARRLHTEIQALP